MKSTGGDIEGVYGLSPLQEGMLFHRILGHDSGVEIFHLVAALPEELDALALRRAWRRIVDHHAIFRTGFRWQGGERPVQEVHREACLEWHQEDWSGRPPEEQERLLVAFLQADHERGFDLTRPPLIRLALFRLGGADWKLVWTAYHGVVDGRAGIAILVEAFAAYETLRHGEEPALPPSVPFRRYIEWLGEQDLPAAEAYWKHLLAGFRAPTPLAAARLARRLPASHEAHGDREIILPEETTAALAKLCGQLAITFNTLLQAAWALLLTRYTDVGDVVFGCVKSNRAAVPLGRGIIGPLINTVVMRVTATEDMRLDALLRQVRAQWLAHRAHEFVPLARVQQWSEIPAETRLFESMVVFENFRWSDALQALGGPWVRRQLSILRQPEYPLTLYGFKGPRLVAKLIYDRRAFAPTTIARMLGHLERILLAALVNPGCGLGEIEILAAAERHQLLLAWNDTRTPVGLAPVHRAFEARAAEHPEAAAVVDGEARLTYGALNRRANRLARFLTAAGVRPEVPVALCLRRSAELVTAALAVLKAEGAYVPLDPAHPARRLALILRELGWPLLLTHADLAPRLGELGSRVVVIDAEPPGEAGWESPNPELPTAPRQLAYLVYTSGSSGRPKGVAVEHRGLLNLVTEWQRALAITTGDRGSLIFNPAFDGSVVEIWPYLAAGASICIPPEETRLSPAQLRDWLLAQGITGSVVPTPVAELLLAQEWPRQAPLRELFTAGDRLTRRPAAGLPFRLCNAYGPAENTVAASWGPVTAEDQDGRAPGIGRPMANVQICLLDTRGRPVPAGVVGEICLGGDGVARGYWRRPALTAERFVPDPFSGEAGARLYRTGDRARFAVTGEIEFSGRTDHQVKVRGMRVELGEIEANLRRHPCLREAVALLQQEAARQRLVAYCVPSSSDPALVPETRELQRFLRQRLPAYMIPGVFVALERLPRTPNGKVDRSALPLPAELGAAAARTRELPRTPAECALAQAWRQALKLERVGLDENFFELGGDSLALIRLQEALRRLFTPGLRMIELMENPTVRMQSQLLGQGPGRGAAGVAATEPELSAEPG
jgi:amino acid adenylation domain-containing protein